MSDISDIPHDDSTYTGDVSDSVFSMDYVRQKAGELQDMMNSLDAGYFAASQALSIDGLDDDTRSSLQTFLDDFDQHRGMIRTTAEAINASAAVINAAGGRMPSLSIPQTLGIVPFVIPAALIAAVVAAGAIITWGVVWLNGLNQRLQNAQWLDAQDTPESRAQLAQTQAQAQTALDAANGSPWASIAGIAKWVGIAALAFLAYKAFSGRKGK